MQKIKFCTVLRLIIFALGLLKIVYIRPPRIWYEMQNQGVVMA